MIKEVNIFLMIFSVIFLTTMFVRIVLIFCERINLINLSNKDSFAFQLIENRWVFFIFRFIFESHSFSNPQKWWSSRKCFMYSLIIFCWIVIFFCFRKVLIPFDFNRLWMVCLLYIISGCFHQAWNWI